MPRPKSNGPRRKKNEDTPHGARPGGRTRENRSDASGSKRPAPFKKGRSDKPTSRSEKPPRRAGKPGDEGSSGPSRFGAKSFGGKRPSRPEGDERRGFRKSSGGEPGADRPRSFGSKRPSRPEGDERRGFRKSSGGEPGADRPRSFGSKRPARPEGDEPRGFRKSSGGEPGADRPRSFGSKRPARPEGDERRGFRKPGVEGADRFKAGGDRPKPGKIERGDSDRPAPRDEKKKSSLEGSEKGDQPDERTPFKKFNRSGVKRGGKTVREDQEQPASSPSVGGPIRLNKFIANSGVCSRREADQLITMGLISVNGKVVTTLGHKVNPGDEVRHEERVLRAEKPVYILMNKPKGFLTTTSDPEERSTVMNLVGGVVKERVYPVGRLDRNTTGLLVLTNDGDLAEKLMHPSHNVKKIYRVELDRPLTKADATKIMEGVQLEEGRAMVDDLAVVSEDKKTVGLEIHIGWNRVVRRIFEALEYQVIKLDRTMYAGLTKKDIPRGEWRFLKREEIVLLKHFK